MSRGKTAYGVAISLLLAMAAYACQGGMDGVLGQVVQGLQANQGLGQSDIVAGLKGALRVGTAQLFQLD